MADLLPVADAQQRLLALAPALAVETVSLNAAAGRWTAAPVTATRTQPEQPPSAMDGYAIRLAQLPGPWDVIRQAPAGRPFSSPARAHPAARCRPRVVP